MKKLKRIPLQYKIVTLAIILIFIPILFANIIYLKHKSVKDRVYEDLLSSINNKWKSSLGKEETLSREELIEKPLEFFQEYVDEENEESNKDNENEDSEEEGDNEDEEEGDEGDDESPKVATNKKSVSDASSKADNVKLIEKKGNEDDEENEGDEEDSGEADGDQKETKAKPKLTEEELKKAKALAIANAESLIEIKAKEVEGYETFVDENHKALEELYGKLKSLIDYLTLFYYSSIPFLILSIILLVFFVTNEAIPFKNITDHLKNFQNEKEDTPQDIVECAYKFDSFLTTAKTLLQESYSISQEIGKKLEPLTVISVFSDDNVKQFFTDVQEISRSSNYIANTLDSTTAHIQEVSASAQTIADRSHEAATDSAETAAIAGEGKNAVSETIDTMESIKDEVLGLEEVIENLNSASKQIGEIVNTITNIAYQTNLLALNAAIEAARAGEHGQGFTVVANEVKKLAEESGEAAEDISKKIKEMLKKTGKAVETINRGASKVIEGVNIANLAGNNLDKIVSSVSNVNKMIQDISNASTEQSQNIDSLRGSIESITGATKITSEGTKRIASAVNEQLAHIRQYITVTKELLTLVQMMGDMLDKFNYN